MEDENKFCMQKIDYITYQQIDLANALAALHNPQTGGIVLFSGEVRLVNKNKEVLFLEYEAYESMARLKIKEIVDFAKKEWHLNNALCVHRLGRLEICDCAVVVVTSSIHRSEAYEANRYIIDRVKSEVPIWKNEHFSDGTNEWGNNSDCNCSVHAQHVNHTHQASDSLIQANKPPVKFFTDKY